VEQNQGVEEHLHTMQDVFDSQMAKLDTMNTEWASSTDSVDASLVSTTQVNTEVAKARNMLDAHLGTEFGKFRDILQQWNQSSIVVENGATAIKTDNTSIQTQLKALKLLASESTGSMKQDSQNVAKVVEQLTASSDGVHTVGNEIVSDVGEVSVSLQGTLSKINNNTSEFVSAMTEDHAAVSTALAATQAKRGETVEVIGQRTESIMMKVGEVKETSEAKETAIIKSIATVGSNLTTKYQDFARGEAEAKMQICTEVSSRCKNVQDGSAEWEVFVDTFLEETTGQFEKSTVSVESNKNNSLSTCTKLDNQLEEFCERTLQMNEKAPGVPECSEVKVSRRITQTPADDVVLSTVTRAVSPAKVLAPVMMSGNGTPLKQRSPKSRSASTPTAALPLSAKENAGNSPTTNEAVKGKSASAKKRPHSAEDRIFKIRTADNVCGSPTAGTPGRKGRPQHHL
jgi:hypothetical protein